MRKCQILENTVVEMETEERRVCGDDRHAICLQAHISLVKGGQTEKCLIY